MQSNKTHDQQMRIVEKRENTANANKGFDITADLKRSEAAKEAFRKGQNLQARNSGDTDDDPGIVRGVNQESEHRKGSGRA
jgi:hypothetical protein